MNIVKHDGSNIFVMLLACAVYLIGYSYTDFQSAGLQADLLYSVSHSLRFYRVTGWILYLHLQAWRCWHLALQGRNLLALVVLCQSQCISAFLLKKLVRSLSLSWSHWTCSKAYRDYTEAPQSSVFFPRCISELALARSYLICTLKWSMDIYYVKNGFPQQHLHFSMEN